MRSNSMGVQINCRVITAVGVSIFVILLTWFYLSPSSSSRLSLGTDVKTVTLPGVNLFARVTSKTAKSRRHILLLHGMAFSSKTWQDVGTLQALADGGWKAVAVDLPGFGRSKKAKIPQDGSNYLGEIIEAANLYRPVIVAPSMSGAYALGYILHGKVDAGLVLRGFVPVAPANTNLGKSEDYKKVQVPTLVVYGENDPAIKTEGPELLLNIPGSRKVIIKGAGHPAYRDNPSSWHSELTKFLNSLEEMEATGT